MAGGTCRSLRSAAAASRIWSTDSRTSTEPGVRAKPLAGRASSVAPPSSTERLAKARRAGSAASHAASYAASRIATAQPSLRGAAVAQRAPRAAGCRAVSGSSSAMERSINSSIAAESAPHRRSLDLNLAAILSSFGRHPSVVARCAFIFHPSRQARQPSLSWAGYLYPLPLGHAPRRRTRL